MLLAFKNDSPVKPVEFRSAMAMSAGRNVFYSCGDKSVTRYRLDEKVAEWKFEMELTYESRETSEEMLQLKLAGDEQMLLGEPFHALRR